MEPWWTGVAEDFAHMGDLSSTVQLIGRLLASALVGGLVGFERERSGQSAGLRTHMLVCLGATFFVLVPLQTQMEIGELARVVQGVAEGIGFLGAGAILKLTGRGEVKGLTTAASIWITAALGVAVGFGQLTLALICCGLVLVILGALHKLEQRLELAKSTDDQQQKS